ncbi:uncharacterized protein YdeI (BOF family) [Paraburkholderia sp. GAS333]|uniref:DUF4148 domain-containing protein n=1 Tax=Paraburkholderia sp. GAS333 TaxID=3156279 RepID=UPI003D1A748D
MMRIAQVTIVITCVACTTSVFAQETGGNAETTSTAASQNSNAANNSGVGMETNGQTFAGSRTGLTRAQVEQDLSNAERSGQLQTLYSTVYKGS